MTNEDRQVALDMLAEDVYPVELEGEIYFIMVDHYCMYYGLTGKNPNEYLNEHPELFENEGDRTSNAITWELDEELDRFCEEHPDVDMHKAVAVRIKVESEADAIRKLKEKWPKALFPTHYPQF